MVVTSVDPEAPRVDTTGIEDYMHGLIQFGQAVLPGTSRATSATGDDMRPLLQVSRGEVRSGGAGDDAPHGARLYRLDENQKVIEEQVIFFVGPQ